MKNTPHTSISTTHHAILPKGVSFTAGAPKGADSAVKRWFSGHGFTAEAAEAHNKARRELGLAPILEIRN